MRALWGGFAFSVMMPVAALAQAAAASETPDMEQVLVIGTSPLLGLGVDPDKIAANVRVFNSGDLRRGGSSNYLRTLEEGAGSLSLVHAQNNPFQPNIVFRGFEASPLNGVAQGMAVYVNGVRFNQMFGDTVNWDLLPDIAVDQMNLEGLNAVFGLNGLGGSLSVQMKNGFTYQGGELEMQGGFFGRAQGAFQYGYTDGTFAAYIGGSGLTESGWRDHSPSDLRQIYGDLGWRGERAEVHVNFTGADNDLTGNGTTPVELLAVDRTAVFTHPDNTRNKYFKFGVSGNYTVSDTTMLQATAYYGDFKQRTLNGDAAEAEACEDEDDELCTEDGETLIGADGDEIPNFVTNGPYEEFEDLFDDPEFDEGGPYAFINRTSTRTKSYGTSLQLTNTASVMGLGNHFVAGASFDRGETDFRASTEIGALTLNRGFTGPTFLINMPDGSIAPVHVKTSNNYYGLYFNDILDITPKMSLTLSGRYNRAETKLRDQIGVALNGDHSYDRFNPGAGLTYKLTPNVTSYVRYSETNRVPTPAELSCADPTAPCSLTNFFVSDPPLKQVISRSVEAGVRGNLMAFDDTKVTWNLGIFNTDNENDITFVPATIIGRAYFLNIGDTRRRGVEAGLGAQTGRWSAFADYTYIDATFRSPVTIGSPENPSADANGNINILRGHKLPGIAPHTFKFGAAYDVTPAWTVAFDGRAVTGQHLFGDENNANPKVPGYVVVNANTSYRINRNFEVFAMVQNLFDRNYETFGTFSATDEVPLIQAPNAANPRALSAAPPIALYGGVRFKF